MPPKKEKDIFPLTGGIIIPWVTANRKTGEKKVVGVLIPQKSLERWFAERNKKRKGKNKYEIHEAGEVRFKDIQIRIYPHSLFPKRKK